MASSSSRLDWCDHIVENIDRIVAHLDGRSVADADDPLTRDAVERCMERISEAIARLHRAKVELAQIEPTIDWRAYRLFGNVLRHEYDGTDPDEVTETLVNELPLLRPAALRLKAALAAE